MNLSMALKENPRYETRRYITSPKEKQGNNTVAWSGTVLDLPLQYTSMTITDPTTGRIID
jgi:hypothetical protein